MSELQAAFIDNNVWYLYNIVSIPNAQERALEVLVLGRISRCDFMNTWVFKSKLLDLVKQHDDSAFQFIDN